MLRRTHPLHFKLEAAMATSLDLIQLWQLNISLHTPPFGNAYLLTIPIPIRNYYYVTNTDIAPPPRVTPCQNLLCNS